MDFSTTCDTIDHNILIHHLQHWFIISSTALNLLSSFLSDRYQTVMSKLSMFVMSELNVYQGVLSCLFIRNSHFCSYFERSVVN